MPVSYNDFVKRPYEEFPYETWHLEELIKCKKSIKYFFKYVKIINGDGYEVQYDPYPFQSKLLVNFAKNRFNCGLCCRQSGKSTTVAIYSTWYAIFNSNKTIGIVSNKKKSAIGFLDRIKGIYERLPNWLKPGVLEYNKSSIEFDNGTKIIVSATTPDAFRSFTINLLICDELGFVPKNQAEDFWSANYPTISASKESKVVVISTPNGLYNLFHNLYTGGETGRNDFKTFKATWKDVPGRDEKWAATERKNIGVVKFNQEYECNFIGSSTTLIDASTLENIAMTYVEPISIELDSNFRVFERPITGSQYVIGGDVATGSGGDDSAIQVMKVITTDPVTVIQVASYNCNTIDPYYFADIIYRVGNYYNGAYIMLENNAEGSITANRLWWSLEYENLYNDTTKALGIKANRKTKLKAAMLMKNLIENGNVKLLDQLSIAQLADYVDKKGKLGGKSLHDDLVSALYWACYFFDTKVMKAVLTPTNKLGSMKKENIWGVLADSDVYGQSSWDDLDDGRSAVYVESF